MQTRNDDYHYHQSQYKKYDEEYYDVLKTMPKPPKKIDRTSEWRGDPCATAESHHVLAEISDKAMCKPLLQSMLNVTIARNLLSNSNSNRLKEGL